MIIRNEVETAVRAEVSRQKDNGRKDFSSCWCTLCDADVTALSMTVLPPRYCTTSCHAPFKEKEKAGTVKNAVFSSMRKVSRRPKHASSAPETNPSKVRLINYNYDEGVAQVATFLLKSTIPCSCQKCRSDILAYALNRYPPRYGVLYGGTTNMPSYQLDFIRHEIGMIIHHAAGIVATQPRHRPAVSH